MIDLKDTRRPELPVSYEFNDEPPVGLCAVYEIWDAGMNFVGEINCSAFCADDAPDGVEYEPNEKAEAVAKQLCDIINATREAPASN